MTTCEFHPEELDQITQNERDHVKADHQFGEFSGSSREPKHSHRECDPDDTDRQAPGTANDQK
jgi:hypothetical protein